MITILGWILFAMTVYKVANTTVESLFYDPFAILGIKSVRTLFALIGQLLLASYHRAPLRKRSRSTLSGFLSSCTSFWLPSSVTTSSWCSSHPDKVKLGANDTFESIQEHFVNITKAYKS